MSSANAQHSWLETFYKDLQTLVDTTFPKKCTKCGLTFASQEDFLKNTIPVRDLQLEDKSGLFALEGGDEETTVGVFRNCKCGTTLMADFQNRRDITEVGLRRRKQFSDLLQMLTEHGVDAQAGRSELLRILRGERSAIIEDLLGDIELP
ncbi:MAG: oxidoreductase [Verrucomicrobia bacterium]|jgi:hypothetical protein|nr:oxidoreductase [Verrucomicrobiota bacterium]